MEDSEASAVAVIGPLVSSERTTARKGERKSSGSIVRHSAGRPGSLRLRALKSATSASTAESVVGERELRMLDSVAVTAEERRAIERSLSLPASIRVSSSMAGGEREPLERRSRPGRLQHTVSGIRGEEEETNTHMVRRGCEHMATHKTAAQQKSDGTCSGSLVT